jgi:hypothetical protein
MDNDGPILEDNGSGSELEEQDEETIWSVKEKYEVIKERFRRIAPGYWAVLSGTAFTYARISERCFALQDWDIKRDDLRVLQSLMLC